MNRLRRKTFLFTVMRERLNMFRFQRCRAFEAETKLVEISEATAQIVSPLQSRFRAAVSRNDFADRVNFPVVLIQDFV